MIYVQNKTWRTAVEPLAAFLALGILFYFSNGFFHQETVQLLAIAILVILFSSQYGIYSAIGVFVLSFLYRIMYGIATSEDILLYFVSREFMYETLFLAVSAVICGLYSTSRQERYKDIVDENTYIKREMGELTATVDQLNETKKVLKERLLENNNHLGTIYSMFKAINHQHPEVVLDRAIEVLKKDLGAKEVAVYSVNGDHSVLRLKVESSETKGRFQKSILDEKPPVIERALSDGIPYFRMEADPQNAPMIAGPVFINDQIQYLIVADRLPFKEVTNHQFELFVWFIRWLGDRLDHAVEWWNDDVRKKTYEGTGIYYPSEMQHVLSIYETREKMFGFPFSYMELSVLTVNVYELQELLSKQLRQICKIDVVGFDRENAKLMIILPNTNAEESKIVLERIKQKIIETKRVEV
ncbi:hypothetical protein [Domibacillus tundrae]|uniref:hypothetical protein n=1 Tax=Domibacillus tundrae TaxID=1587527 RepID=UPI000617B556|nr:hypothetical protein [Domibacillus tundrae]